MTFAADIDGIVRASKAYNNKFFANCHDTSKYAHINDVAEMMINWYLVTKHFGLSAPEYTALLARRLKYASGEKATLLQHLLVESGSISADDLGIGHEELYQQHGGRDIPVWQRVHYLLWGNATKKLIQRAQEIRWPIAFPFGYGVPKDEAERREAYEKTEREERQDQLVKNFNTDLLDSLNMNNAEETGLVCPATRTLVERIEDEFQSLEGGVSVYQTVESIAYNIVDAYDKLMQRFNSRESPIFAEEDWVYLGIHKPLEKDHDRQSTRMIDLAENYFGQGYRPVIESKVRELCGLFSNFWNEINQLVFKEETREPPV